MFNAVCFQLLVQRYLIFSCIRDGVCLLRGKKRVFKYSSVSYSSLKLNKDFFFQLNLLARKMNRTASLKHLVTQCEKTRDRSLSPFVIPIPFLFSLSRLRDPVSLLLAPTRLFGLNPAESRTADNLTRRPTQSLLFLASPSLAVTPYLCWS